MAKRVIPFSDIAITRRDAIRAGLCGGAALFLHAAFPRNAFAQQERSPNIVFILSDNQRWDFMSCAGHPFVQTPNMDRLAAEGVLFSNAFVTTSLCSPARASFLTGQYAHTHGVQNNLTVWNNDNVTFLELLKSVGYDTAFIGKWHMPGRLPILRGVDLFVTFTIQKGQGRYIDCPLIVNGVDTPSRKPYITEELTDYALEFITKPRENPFCLYLSHKAVHHRWIPPPEMANLYEDKEPIFPKEFDPLVLLTRGFLFEGFNLGSARETYLNYARCVTALDYHIGRVLDTLEELGIADNTMVVFASDGGFFWGEHQLAGTGKWPYEESVRVPFIVRAPGIMSDAGRRAEQMVLNIDVAPTILEMAGLPVPENMEGQSFVPILKSESAPSRKAWLFENFLNFPFREPEMYAVRTESHKYIEYKSRKKEELFDIVADPREMHNLMNTAEGASLAPEMRKMLIDLQEGKKF